MVVVLECKRLTVDGHGCEQALKRSLHQVNRKDVRVPDAPVFRPTVEEFGDPLKYITGIRHLVQKSGIAKIVPPEGENKDAQTRGKERAHGSCACAPAGIKKKEGIAIECATDPKCVSTPPQKQQVGSQSFQSTYPADFQPSCNAWTFCSRANHSAMEVIIPWRSFGKRQTG